MTLKHPKIEFENNRFPSSSFDLVDIQKVLTAKYENHSPFELHRIDFFTIVLYTAGNELHTIDFNNYPCKKGTVLLLRKGQLHKFSESTVEGVILVFTYDFLSSYFTKSEVENALLIFNEFLKQPAIQLTEQQLVSMQITIEQIQHEYLNMQDEQSPKIIRSLLQVIINTVYRVVPLKHSTETNKKYLSDFICFQGMIEADYNPTTKVNDYAQRLGIHPKTLNTITQRVVSKSAKTFIDEILINNIKRQLLNAPLSIKEIAYQCGFAETTNFNNYFKKRVGKTPLEFRKNKN